ncbi:hypothetical protein HUB98_05610 [Paenibacillus barcinonensis]|uniref:Uncharacterized protein n=1 Tax=Paenibacillus barcinonensis TaxID=198119 RepID=A0A2V4VVI5_PAEBA|nr:hypothetical protein [Paenibacillus barcinonensis]PYE51467.1 hypothetical protein DFQ00_102261 [Paenibacillus barcinonensis]QKS55857.1 hypothetical protein HUB98_05610 [Paenibacillus barcinonensis]
MTKYADWYYVREAEKVGLVASMDGVVERNRTELNNRLSAYFRNKMPGYNSYFNEDQCDDVLYSINEYINENKIDKYEIDFPISEGSDIHLLQITDNLQLKILVADEYHGGGDYSKYINVDKFIINEQTTEQDVDMLIEFINKYLNICR